MKLRNKTKSNPFDNNFLERYLIPLIVSIQFLIETTLFRLQINFIDSRVRKASTQKFQCANLFVTEHLKFLPGGGMTVLPFTLSNNLSMKRHSCPVSSADGCNLVFSIFPKT